MHAHRPGRGGYVTVMVVEDFLQVFPLDSSGRHGPIRKRQITITLVAV